MFAHSLNIFDDGLKMTMQQFLFVDSNAVGEVKCIRRLIDKENKTYMEDIISKTEIFNPNRFSHYMLFYNVSTRYAAITKAKLHNDNVPIHPDIKKFHELLSRIQAQAYSPTLLPQQDPQNNDEMEETTEDEINISIDADDISGI